MSKTDAVMVSGVIIKSVHPQHPLHDKFEASHSLGKRSFEEIEEDSGSEKLDSFDDSDIASQIELANIAQDDDTVAMKQYSEEEQLQKELALDDERGGGDDRGSGSTGTVETSFSRRSNVSSTSSDRFNNYKKAKLNQSVMKKVTKTAKNEFPIVKCIVPTRELIAAAICNTFETLSAIAHCNSKRSQICFWNPFYDPESEEAFKLVVESFGHRYISSGSIPSEDFIHPTRPFTHPEFANIDCILSAPLSTYADRIADRFDEINELSMREHKSFFNFIIFSDLRFLFGASRGPIFRSLNFQPCVPKKTARCKGCCYPAVVYSTCVDPQKHSLLLDYNSLVKPIEKEDIQECVKLKNPGLDHAEKAVPFGCLVDQIAKRNNCDPKQVLAKTYQRIQNPAKKTKVQDDMIDDISTPIVFAAVALANAFFLLRDRRSCLADPWSVLDPCAGRVDGEFDFQNQLATAIEGLVTPGRFAQRSISRGPQYDVLKLGTEGYPITQKCIITHPPRKQYRLIIDHLLSLQKQKNDLLIGVFLPMDFVLESNFIMEREPSLIVTSYTRIAPNSLPTNVNNTIRFALIIWSGKMKPSCSGLQFCSIPQMNADPTHVDISTAYVKAVQSGKNLTADAIIAEMQERYKASTVKIPQLMKRPRSNTKQQRIASLKKEYEKKRLL
jgi:hypothetical protein